MPYCPECGSPVEPPAELPAEAIADAAEAAAEGQVGAAAEIGSAEVQIAQINADRDIKLARIAKGMNETALEAEIAVAEVLAEAEPAPAEPEIVIDDPAPPPEPAEEPPPAVEPADAGDQPPKDRPNPWWR